MDVEPKICADHFLLMLSRSLRPRTMTGISSEREAASMRERKVWLPIFASTACVCFWLVGSARAVTRSCESFLISGLSTRAPISRSTTPVAVRISARTSSAASASFGTISGRHCASCCGVWPSICRRQGASTSMQPAFVFHFLSSMPARRSGTATTATPWPFGTAPSTMAHAAFTAGPPSLLSPKRAMSLSRRGSTKGVAAASAASRCTAVALAAAASLPAAAKAASISAMTAGSAVSTLAAGFSASVLASAFAPFFSAALAVTAARSASRAAWASASLMSARAFTYVASCWSFFSVASSSFFLALLGSSLAASAASSIFISCLRTKVFFSSNVASVTAGPSVGLAWGAAAAGAALGAAAAALAAGAAALADAAAFGGPAEALAAAFSNLDIAGQERRLTEQDARAQPFRPC
mmetsp:Transcript_10031/g.30687  ORF Transcript_10031/g.30687 Transcript_10031/m.30687 type:complete len:412 (+) Transcript_10031:1589-2824(+)